MGTSCPKKRKLLTSGSQLQPFPKGPRTLVLDFGRAPGRTLSRNKTPVTGRLCLTRDSVREFGESPLRNANKSVPTRSL